MLDSQNPFADLDPDKVGDLGGAPAPAKGVANRALRQRPSTGSVRKRPPSGSSISTTQTSGSIRAARVA